MNKFLGQHFLKNQPMLKKIAGALDLAAGDTVVEIGAGHGELTEAMEHEARGREQKVKIIAIEKDGKLAEFLRKKFAGENNIEIREGDAIKILPQIAESLNLKIENHKLKIAGNIPYYITGRLLRVVGGLDNKPALCVFTLQKEVAERLAAKPAKMNSVRSPADGRLGGRQKRFIPDGMNRLAASVQFWAEPEILFYLPKENFSPPPEVDSAAVKLKTTNYKLKIGADKYYETVRRLFAQPRKTILNNLGAGNGRAGEKTELSEKLLKIGVNPRNRPQNLTIEDIKKIAVGLMTCGH